MKISILMPVFNTEKYLTECIESILAQTEKDWELLVVNDFSTDQSFELLKRFEGSDERIRVFQNKEKGIIPALRVAFENSEGELITRMDSDDVMYPQKLACLKRPLVKMGAGNLAVGGVEYFSEEGVGEGFRKYEEWLNGMTEQGKNFDDIYKECSIPSPSWMIHRDDLIRAGAFEPNVYPEDYDLVFRFREIGLKIIPSQKVVHRWRDRPERASRTDANYRDFTFIQLKARWFVKSDYNFERPLVLWGAGKKGKRIARILNEEGISFGWVTNNPEKIGKEIRGVELREIDILKRLNNPQIIIAVASPTDQIEIENELRDLGMRKNEHYFFFC